MPNAPVITGSIKEQVCAVGAKESIHSENFKKIHYNPVSEKVLMPGRLTDLIFTGISDNNRSMIFPDIVIENSGRNYALSVKGMGARTPLYGSSPLAFSFCNDFDHGRKDLKGLAGSRLVTSESWFGEAPYGAQGETSANFGLEITQLSTGCNINGFYICPVIEVNEFPSSILNDASRTYWYRKYQGKYVQEQRLVPSNIRLYHQSEITVGQTTAGALRAFEITTVEELDMFIDNYISSGIAALTLYARTLRHCKHGFEGLDYVDVWLDKDSVIARDGTIHFADIEGLDWLVAGCDLSLEKRIRRQFDRNFYEFMYGLDALMRERISFTNTSLNAEDLRSALAIRFEIALGNDSFVKCEHSAKSMDIVIKPRIGAESVPVRMLDFK